MVIGLPPVLNFGKGAVREKVLNEVLSGKKVPFLIIYTIIPANSSPLVGSDIVYLSGDHGSLRWQ